MRILTTPFVLLVSLGVFGGLVYCSPLTDLLNRLKPDVTDVSIADGADASKAPTCRMRRTMAWRECGGPAKCATTCQSGDDCTFPYCNALGLCECTKTWCSSDETCLFFRIGCNGNFTCRNRECNCDA